MADEYNKPKKDYQIEPGEESEYLRKHIRIDGARKRRPNPSSSPAVAPAIAPAPLIEPDVEEWKPNQYASVYAGIDLTWKFICPALILLTLYLLLNHRIHIYGPRELTGPAIAQVYVPGTIQATGNLVSFGVKNTTNVAITDIVYSFSELTTTTYVTIPLRATPNPPILPGQTTVVFQHVDPQYNFIQCGVRAICRCTISKVYGR